MASEGLESVNNPLSDKFNRRLQEWGNSIPDISIDNFLHENKDICGLKEEVDSYWKGKNLRDFCFAVVVHERNNEQEEVVQGLKKPSINPERKKELYKALTNYTTKKITKFKEEEKQAITSKKDLIKTRDEILGFVRAREALKEQVGKDYSKVANEQEVRDAKIVKKLTGKT